LPRFARGKRGKRERILSCLEIASSPRLPQGRLNAGSLGRLSRVQATRQTPAGVTDLGQKVW
jgi:hypothetical protein